MNLKTHTTSVLASIIAFALPQLAQAVTYSADGAIIVGGQMTTESNIAAAAFGANLSLMCLGIVALQLLSIYIFHELWHPKRVHEKMTEAEVHRGSIKFYMLGTLVWMLVAVMAESWCLILPLAVILAGAILYYVFTISTSVDDPATSTG